MSPKPKVVIAGDALLTWRVIHDRSRKNGKPDNSDPEEVRVVCQPNGWVLMHDLLKHVLPGAVFHTPQPPPGDVAIGDAPFHHSVTTWSLFDESDAVVYRREQNLGWDRGTPFLGVIPDAGFPYHQVRNDPPDPDLVVLDDWGLGYRTALHLWPLAIRRTAQGGKPMPWVLLRMSHPLLRNNLLCRDLLHDKALAKRVVLLASVNDLRRMDIELNREMSWDQTVGELLRALDRRDLLFFGQAAASIFACEDAGAMVFTRGDIFRVSPDPNVARVRLCFRPKEMEWVQGGGHRGRIPGQLKCLTAALAARLCSLTNNPSAKDAMDALEHGVKDGLVASQYLFKYGYGTTKEFNDRNVRFPSHVIGPLLRAALSPEDMETEKKANLHQEGGWFMASIEGTMKELVEPVGGNWNLLDRMQQQEQIPLYLDEMIVLKGPLVALAKLPLPVGKFGDLITLIHSEIQSYRNIRRLLSEYARAKPTKPLSIAVFGPPGSGKSFAVIELAKGVVAPDSLNGVRTFNLSQFTGPENLLGAFHQVRDIGLSGRLPIIFWDEFDCPLGDTALGWLRYFLAPMEDGQFQEGQVTHPIGPAVFVFAGGTRHTFRAFNSGADGPTTSELSLGQDSSATWWPVKSLSPAQTPSSPTEQDPNSAWRAVKGPDFVSRLKGTLDVPGVNPEPGCDDQAKFRCRLRRAIILHHTLAHSTLGLFRDGHLQIDGGVLNALLRTREYRHGVRSLKAVVAMSLLHGRQRFDRSSLPENSQLELHVDANDFRHLVRAR